MRVDEDEGGKDPAEEIRELVVSAKKGNSESFGRLVVLHQRAVTRLAQRLLRDPDEANAAAQDAFVKAWGSLKEFRGECPFGAWVSRIVVNICRDQLKRKKVVVIESRLVSRSKNGEIVPGPLETARDRGPDPESQALFRELGRRIAELMAALPLMQREVFALRYYEDRPLAEIAALYQVDVGTIKTHLFRATHRVRKSLEALYGPSLPI